MTIDEFWQIIEDVHARSGGDMDRKCALLRERLLSLDADRLRGFRAHFDACYHRAYDYHLWGAAYLIGGGCGDDAFSDFRSTLISQGRTVFEPALADPDSLADLPLTGDNPFYEGYAYVVTEAEKKVLGAAPPRPVPHPAHPSGEHWDDDETLPTRYPRLHRKHSSSDGDSNKPWWKFW